MRLSVITKPANNNNKYNPNYEVRRYFDLDITKDYYWVVIDEIKARSRARTIRELNKKLIIDTISLILDKGVFHNEDSNPDLRNDLIKMRQLIVLNLMK